MADDMTWDECAATWDEGEAQRAYAQGAFESLQKVASRYGVPLRGARICDFGCGTGLLAEKLAPLAGTVDAVDSSRAMLDVLKAKIARLAWDQVHPFAAMPTDRGPYDLIVCSSVCAFLDDYPATVEELVRRLRPDGLFVQWDWELNPDAEEPMGFSRQDISACLEGAGLHVLAVETAFSASVVGHTMRPLMGVGRRPPR